MLNIKIKKKYLFYLNSIQKEESAPKVEKKEEKVAKPKQNGSTQEHKEKAKKVPQHNAAESKENKERNAKLAVEVSVKTKPEVIQPVPEKQEPVVVASQVVLQTNGIVQNKEKKKKKGEVNPFQQIGKCCNSLFNVVNHIFFKLSSRTQRWRGRLTCSTECGA